MTSTEHAIIQAAFDYVGWQHALDLGMPAQTQRNKAQNDLIGAVADHASENDGRLIISEEV